MKEKLEKIKQVAKKHEDWIASAAFLSTCVGLGYLVGTAIIHHRDHRRLVKSFAKATERLAEYRELLRNVAIVTTYEDLEHIVETGHHLTADIPFGSFCIGLACDAHAKPTVTSQ